MFGTQLTGGIPSSFGGFKFMTGMFVYDNLLSMTVPTELSGNSLLQYLNLQNNYLTQSLPSSVMRIRSLINFQVEANLLSGLNPVALGVGPSLNYLVASQNIFSGSLPSNFTAFQSIQYLYLDNNRITGHLPQYGECLSSSTDDGENPSCASLNQLSLFNNRLTGSIPLSIGSHTAITVVALSNNNFHGSLPSNLYKLSQLAVLNISGNFFSGRIDDIFPANFTGDKFPNLIYIDFSNNSFTGTIPSGIFLSQSLQVISLSSNCFSGTLPLSLCDSQNLESVVLNSLSSGQNCDVNIPMLSNYLRGVFPLKIMSGSVPTCLWSLSTLSTLHISGNGLSGYIPETPLYAGLTNVELGGNALTGTIPISIQSHGRFTSLGLQQNKLTGVLSESFVASLNDSNVTSLNLNLKVNRLSGSIPTSFYALQDVDILTGNMFACIDTNSLPLNDPLSKYYTCGSVALNTALITWSILVVGVVVLWCLFLVAVNRISRSSHTDAYTHAKSISALIDIRRQRNTSCTNSEHTEALGREAGIADHRQGTEYGISSNVSGLSSARTSSVVLESRQGSLCTTDTACDEVSGYDGLKRPKPRGHKMVRLKDIVARVFLKTVRWHSIRLDVIRCNIRNTYQFLDVLRGVSNGMIVLSLVYCFVCMSYYICIKNVLVGQNYSTQLFQYAWLLSSSFLHGYLPATFILAFLFCSLYLMCSSIRRRVVQSGDDVEFPDTATHQTDSDDQQQRASSAKTATDCIDSEAVNENYPQGWLARVSSQLFLRVHQWPSYIFRFVVIPVILQGINGIVTIAVNAEYVQASEVISPNYLILLQSSLSAFKIGWACLYVPWAMSNLRSFSVGSQLRHQVTMYIVVVVVSPVLAAAATDQRCFYEAIFGSPSITTSYSVPSIQQSCTEFLVYDEGISDGFPQASIDCSNTYETTTVYSTATPPFIYSYQCGSAILVDFVPVLVYTYVFSSIILPFIRFTFLHTLSMLSIK
jgi:hypothetical protein